MGEVSITHGYCIEIHCPDAPLARALFPLLTASSADGGTEVKPEFADQLRQIYTAELQAEMSGHPDEPPPFRCASSENADRATLADDDDPPFVQLEVFLDLWTEKKFGEKFMDLMMSDALEKRMRQAIRGALRGLLTDLDSDPFRFNIDVRADYGPDPNF